MTSKQPTLVVIFALCMGLLSSCATDDSARELDETLQLYASHVRWGHFRTAAQFLDPEKRPDNKTLEFDISRLEQVRVTGYQKISQIPAAEPDSYIQLVEMRLANRHTAVERTITDRQVWVWKEDSQRWWLTSGLPDITRR